MMIHLQTLVELAGYQQWKCENVRDDDPFEDFGRASKLPAIEM